jgi:hypothetical protein
VVEADERAAQMEKCLEDVLAPLVERTLAWLSKYRRLTVRYERREDIHEAFLHLGCSLICLNYLM